MQVCKEMPQFGVANVLKAVVGFVRLCIVSIVC